MDSKMKYEEMMEDAKHHNQKVEESKEYIKSEIKRIKEDFEFELFFLNLMVDLEYKRLKINK